MNCPNCGVKLTGEICPACGFKIKNSNITVVDKGVLAQLEIYINQTMIVPSNNDRFYKSTPLSKTVHGVEDGKFINQTNTKTDKRGRVVRLVPPSDSNEVQRERELDAARKNSFMMIVSNISKEVSRAGAAEVHVEGEIIDGTIGEKMYAQLRHYDGHTVLRINNRKIPSQRVYYAIKGEDIELVLAYRHSEIDGKDIINNGLLFSQERNPVVYGMQIRSAGVAQWVSENGFIFKNTTQNRYFIDELTEILRCNKNKWYDILAAVKHKKKEINDILKDGENPILSELSNKRLWW